MDTALHPTWSANAATFCPAIEGLAIPGTFFGGLSSSGKMTSFSWNTSCTLTMGSLFIEVGQFQQSYIGSTPNQPVTVNHEDDISGIPNWSCNLWLLQLGGGVDAKHTLHTRKTPCAVVLIEAAPMGFLGWRFIFRAQWSHLRDRNTT